MKFIIKEQNINFVDSKEIRLNMWEEIIGYYQKMEVNDFSVAIYLEYSNKTKVKLTFFGEDERKIILSNLKDSYKGKKIGLLKTDLHFKPIIVRIFKNEK